MKPTAFSLTLALAALTALCTACGPQPQVTAPSAPAPVLPQVAVAADWLLSRQTGAGAINESDDTASPGQTALAALALTLSGREVTGPVRANLETLLPNAAATPSDLARLVFFALASGDDPRQFGSHHPVDVIARLLEICTPNACGRSNAERAQVVLALGLAHEPVNPSLIGDITRAQFSSGGWPHPFDGDSESIRTTAWTVLALAALETAPEVRQSAERFLVTRQHADGAWSNSQRQDESEAGATALALMALRVSNSDIPPIVLTKATTALLAFQQADGAFTYYRHRPGTSVESTALAALALSDWPRFSPTLIEETESPPIPAWMLGVIGSGILLSVLMVLRRTLHQTKAWGGR